MNTCPDTGRVHPRPFSHCYTCGHLVIISAGSPAPDTCKRCGASGQVTETLDVRLIDCRLCPACSADLPTSGQPFNVFLETAPNQAKDQTCSHCHNQRNSWPDLAPTFVYAVARWHDHGFQAYQIIARR